MKYRYIGEYAPNCGIWEVVSEAVNGSGWILTDGVGRYITWIRHPKDETSYFEPVEEPEPLDDDDDTLVMEKPECESSHVNQVKEIFDFGEDEIISSANILAETGLKHDDGKLRWDLLAWEAVQDVVAVCTMGARKYGDNNWKKGIKVSRLIAAVHRHVHAFVTGEYLDKESNLPHLAHAAWGLLAILWMVKNKPEFCDIGMQ